MDYGVYLKKTIGNQNQRSKHYVRQSQFIGSKRQIRGLVIKNLLEHKALTQAYFVQQLAIESSLIETVLADLLRENLVISDQQGRYTIPSTV